MALEPLFAVFPTNSSRKDQPGLETALIGNGVLGQKLNLLYYKPVSHSQISKYL